jgi:UDP-N-acetylmuramate--alanine ligase
MGIGGQGISAVAQMALLAGETVTGCDRQASATTRALERVGIPVQIGHSADHLADVDTLVISPAVPALDPRNPELLAAQQRGIRVVTWQEVLGELMRGKCVLSISGVHGKGTATAMLSLMLVDAGLDPTCEIGAVVPRFGANYRLGKGSYFVNEADEFNHNFWHYHPRVAVVKSIEFEHPEFFPDYEAFLAAFEHFIRGMDMQGDWPIPPTLVLNADSPGCLELRSRLNDWGGRVVFYHIEHNQQAEQTEQQIITQEQAIVFIAYDVRLEGETSFRVNLQYPQTDRKEELGVSSQPTLQSGKEYQGESRASSDFALEERRIHLSLPGLYNVENALAALTVARLIGVDLTTIVKTLESFGGTRRRFEIRHQGTFSLNRRMLELLLVDDYAHHPTAIAATLAAARKRYPERRLVAVYQPHMYSRTKTFFEQFLHSFDEADVTIISDIFPAREQDTGLVHARTLVEAMARRPHFAQGKAQMLYGGTLQETTQRLCDVLRTGDLVVIMGAGDIYTVTEELLQQATALTGKETL